MNTNVGHYLTDDDFAHDPNPHKHAMLWASKFYRVLNNIMRHADTIADLPPNTKQFVNDFVSYFRSHGLKKPDIMALAKCLYRGIDKTHKLKKHMRDNGFMSTSRSFNIAKKFAGDSGKIIHLKTKDLPDDVPFVRIDESLADYLHEQEILLLPGTLELTIVNKEIRGIYNVRRDIMETMKTQQGGKTSNTMDTFLMSAHTDMNDLKGRIIIWWKHDRKGNAESLNFTKLPNKNIHDYWKRVVLDIDDYLSSVIQYMSEKTMIYMAILNPKTLEIETLHYGMPRSIFIEHVDVDKYEKRLIESIIEENKWLIA